MINTLKNKLFCLFVSVLVFTTQHVVAAPNSTISLDGGGSGIYAKVTKVMQETVDFLGGPGVLFVSFVGISAALALWIMVPKSASAVIGWLARGVAGSIGIMNLALILTWVQSV